MIYMIFIYITDLTYNKISEAIINEKDDGEY